jgi:aspartate racemase
MTEPHARMRQAGVLGGMGPEATLVFLEKFYSLTRGRLEQARPALLVNIDPQVPDRNKAWSGSGMSPAASLAQMGRRLKQAGADFCVMACVTAHGYVESFETDVGIPLIRMPDVVADALRPERREGNPEKPQRGDAGRTATTADSPVVPRRAPGASRDSLHCAPVGLLATTTTLEMKLFQTAFAARNNPLILPDKIGQEALMRAIYAIKKGEDARSIVLAVAKSLVARGARRLLLGCTDLSVLSPVGLEGCTVVDALELLAERTLAEIEKG